MEFRKNIYTEEYLRKLGLNGRQINAVAYVKEKGKITNKEYQELTNISRQTATIDLSEMVKKMCSRGQVSRAMVYPHFREYQGRGYSPPPGPR